MVTIYITSLAKDSGRTTFCAGIGQRFLEDGKKVGYLKIATEAQGNNTVTEDSDAAFMKSILSLDETIEQICPVIKDTGNFPSRARESLGHVSTDNDIVIVEGDYSTEVIKSLDARVILIATTTDSAEDRLTIAGKNLGKRLLGVVLNKVPATQYETTSSQVKAILSSEGINVMAVIPDDRTLFSLTVGEVAECVQGEFLNNAEKAGELVQNLMLGAMTVDTGPLYYNIKADKAAIIRSERPDMQLAALQTPTKCLVLSGDHAPEVQVMNEAEEKGVPIIQTGNDVATIVSSLEKFFTDNRFKQEKKLKRLSEVLGQRFDFPVLYKGLGLTG